MSLQIGRLNSLHAGVAVCAPGSTTANRVAETYAFVWVIEGGAISSDGTALPTGSLLLARPGDEMALRYTDDGLSRIGWVGFDIVSGLDELPPSDEWPFSINVDTESVLLPLIRHVLWCYINSSPGWEAAASASIANLVTSYATQAHGLFPARPALSPVVERTLRYVGGQWTKASVLRPIPIDELCEACQTSRRTLIRTFTQSMGMPPSALLRLFRLEMAARLLNQSDYTLAEIARLTGFGSAFYLSRAFKSTAGRSPAAFRREHRPSILDGRDLGLLGGYLYSLLPAML